MKPVKYYLKKLLRLWPPSKDSHKRMFYDLGNAEEDYSGEV